MKSALQQNRSIFKSSIAFLGDSPLETLSLKDSQCSETGLPHEKHETGMIILVMKSKSVYKGFVLFFDDDKCLNKISSWV